jgi:disulfide bond formation protein DsbB
VSTDTVTLFFALLAVAAQVASVVLVVALVRRQASVLSPVGESALQLILVVALVATLGSLYLSEVANFVPCTLCWYQRIAMYPLVPLALVAVVRRESPARMAPYVLALAIPGGLVSIYHALIERFPDLDSGACAVGVPCSFIWVERFGYLTIPVMALSAFALISLLAVVSLRSLSPKERS